MLGRGAALRNSLRSLRSLRSDNRSESEHEAWACCAAHARPTPCASRHGQRGGEVHTGHRCARPWHDSLFLWERVGVRATPPQCKSLFPAQGEHLPRKRHLLKCRGSGLAHDGSASERRHCWILHWCLSAGACRMRIGDGYSIVIAVAVAVAIGNYSTVLPPRCGNGLTRVGCIGLRCEVDTPTVSIRWRLSDKR